MHAATRSTRRGKGYQVFPNALTLVRACRSARDARVRQSVDRNSFRSPRGARDSGNVQPRPLGSTSVRTDIHSQSPSARRHAGETPALPGRTCFAARGRDPRAPRTHMLRRPRCTRREAGVSAADYAIGNDRRCRCRCIDVGARHTVPRLIAIGNDFSRRRALCGTGACRNRTARRDSWGTSLRRRRPSCRRTSRQTSDRAAGHPTGGRASVPQAGGLVSISS